MNKKRKAPAKKAKRVGVPRTPPYAPFPSWTTSKFFGFLRSGLRSTYNKWPPKWEVLKEAKRPYKGDDKRTKWEYKCAKCKEYYKSKEVSVDHIEPAGSLNSFDDLPGFVERLFCGVEGLQLLCTGCHQLKTSEERKIKENNK